MHYLDISVPRDQWCDYVLEAAFQFVSGEFIMVDFFCTDGLKSERHVSNRNDGKESPGQCPKHLGLLSSGCLVT